MFSAFLHLLHSCSSTKHTAQTVKPSSCDTTITNLNFPANSVELNWLSENVDQCNRINEFLRMFGYTEESKAYIREFVKMKLEDDEYKLERFIELYCLLNQNPNALIDGTLDKPKKEK